MTAGGDIGIDVTIETIDLINIMIGKGIQAGTGIGTGVDALIHVNFDY